MVLEAVDAEGLIRPHRLARHHIPLPGAEVRYPLGLGKASLAPAHGLLGLFALGDVPGHGTQRCPAIVGDHRSAGVHDYHRAILPTVQPLAYVASLLLEAAPNVLVDVLCIVV